MAGPTTAQEAYIAALFADVDKSAARLENVLAREVEITEKLTLALGATAGSIIEMNLSADRLVESTLINLNNHANQMVGLTIKKQIEDSLGEAVKEEIKKVRLATDEIVKNVDAMKKRSILSQAGAMVGCSLAGALLAFGISWYTISSGKLYVRDVSTPVEQQAASNVKQLPKAK